MTTIAIIPARGGSKRIPGKNIKPFMGKPIIAYSIETAIKSGLFDRVIVSTDCQRIKAVAEFYDAQVPFIRSPDLADDHTGVMDVVRDAVIRYGGGTTYVCLIYATAPMLTADKLAEGLTKIQHTDAPYVLSVTGFGFPVQRALVLGDDQKVTAFIPQTISLRAQDITAMVHDAAQFCWCKSRAVIDRVDLYGGDTIAVHIPKYQACDIDTPADWTRAELMYQAWRAQGNG
jgi:pseudaminic acid cytidylyltransferase